MKTGLESLDTGAPKITYSGNEGPQAPQQMAMADPMLVEQYQQYVFEMQEQALQPMSFEEFVAQARAGMNKGGIANTKTIKGQPHMLAYITPSEAGTLKDLGGQETMTPEGIPAYPPPGEYGGPGYTGKQETNRERGIRAAATSPSRTGRQDPMGSGYYETPKGEQELKDQSRRIEEMRQRGEGVFASDDLEDDPGTKIDPTIKTKDDDSFLRTFEKKSIDNFVRRNKYKHLIESGLYSDFPGLAGKFLGYMNPDEEVDDFDIDSIREIASIYGGDLTPKQTKGLEGLRRDFEFEQKYPNPTTKDLREYYNLDKDPGQGGDGPPPIVYPYPYPTSTAMAPEVVPPVQTANPFLPATNLPFATYGTVPHGAQFGVDTRMFAADGGRIGYAGGGIADLRQGYFLGKLVKKATRAVKKIIKSPIGKAALIGGLGYFAGGGGNPFTALGRGKFNFANLLSLKNNRLLSSIKDGERVFSPFKAISLASTLPFLASGTGEEEEEGINYADLPNIFDKYSPTELRRRTLAGEVTREENPFLQPNYYAANGGRVGLMGGGNIRAAALNQLYGINDDEEDKKFSRGGSAGLPPITAGVESQASQSFSDDETPTPTQPDQMPRPMPNPMMMARGMNPMMRGMNPMMRGMNPMMARGMMPRMMAQEGGRIGYAGGGNVFELLQKELEGTITPEELKLLEKLIKERGKDSLPFAQGGRIRAQEGGLMDMGGMEKDYRNEGGFVPIGGQERADDVPARLSKNEFVFTADAVRAAGGGDIDRGAEVMENMMENLEKGGKVSEESQGLKGARDMFATAQRLERVL